MTHPITSRLLERRLVETVECLAVEFPDLAIGTISRAVGAVADRHRDVDVRALSGIVDAVLSAARADLGRLTEGVAA